RKDAAIRKKIVAAREALPEIEANDTILSDCAELCIALGSDGLRGELTLLKAARALAAYQGDATITREHLRSVAPIALSHRLRRDPLDEAGSGARVMRSVESVLA
ncbi:MAG: magnesium chelatase ATPase subunit I, partial [Pseudomonadota bacterium]